MDASRLSSTTVNATYIRISIWPDDPRKRGNATSSRNFLVRLVDVGPSHDEHIIDEFTVSGSLDDLIGLLHALRVDCVNMKSVLNTSGWLFIDVVPLVFSDLIQRLQHGATPVDCFVRSDRSEIERSLRLWKSQHKVT
jgi:hypothetical protein